MSAAKKPTIPVNTPRMQSPASEVLCPPAQILPARGAEPVKPIPAPDAAACAIARRHLEDLTFHNLLYVLCLDQPNLQELTSQVSDLAQGRSRGPLPEVLPDGQVISGAVTVLAARKVGLVQEIDVVVREDLRGLGEREVKLAIIDNALASGRLHPICAARCITLAHTLRDDTPPDQPRYYPSATVVGQLASYLGSSEQKARRCLRLLLLPIEVQEAIIHEDLPLKLAERVLDVSANYLAKMEVACREGSLGDFLEGSFYVAPREVIEPVE